MRTTERKEVFRDFFSNEKSGPVDDEIARILTEMKRAEVTSEEYSLLATRLERLTEIKSKMSHETINRDTLALIGGNLMGILMIVAYEQRHVMTSQGFRQIIRPR